MGNTALETEVAPPWPHRLPGRDAPDGVMRVRGGVASRLLHVRGRPVVARAWNPTRGRVAIRAEAVDPAALDGGSAADDPAGREELERAVALMRFALSVDDDLGPFYESVKHDRLIGPVVRRRPWVRPRRRPHAWEALAWAITAQLIEASHAAQIERRIVRRWGPRLGPPGRAGLYDVPDASMMAGRAPAELESMELAGVRALAMVRVAREVAAGRAPLEDGDCDHRLLAIPSIGPWTVQCLRLHGCGDPDSLPAGDLAYLKLVACLRGMRRRATVEEVEDFFRPYAPYRGLAGLFALVGYHGLVAKGPPLRKAA